MNVLLRFLWISLLFAVPASAQIPVVHADSVAGYADGVALGKHRGVVGRAAAGFTGGFLMGLLGPAALFGGAGVGIAGATIGAVTSIAGAQAGDAGVPNSLILPRRDPSDSYRAGLAVGYSSQVKKRRRIAAIFGTVAGAATGVRMLIAALED